MKLNYCHSAKDPTYSIATTVRINGKVSTVKVEEIGRHSDLLKITDDPKAYAEQKVKEYNDRLKNNVVTCTAEIDFNLVLNSFGSDVSKPTYINIGYFFFQSIYQKLKLNSFFKEATADNKIQFDCDMINRFLTYARILDPKSKLGTYDDLETYFEKPDIHYHQIFRFMDILEQNASGYLKHLYQNSTSIVKRDSSVMYYDCTNYYFETEHHYEEVVDEVTGEVISALQQYGVSKENRPNPIVEMGLIMDARGIPVSMCIHPGNTSEQLTAIPLEKEVIDMIGTSKFIYCADAGLGSYNIRQFNSMGGRAFIVTQSIKKLSNVLKEAVFNDCDYRLLSNNKKISVEYMKTFNRFDENNLDLYNDSAYKVLYADKVVDLGLLEEKTYKNGNTRMVKAKGNLKQRVIVTFSRKMMEYQRSVRNRQIERARKMLERNDPEEIKKGPNDVRRFMKRVTKTKSGETADISYILDEAKIAEEERYDGYYAAATNLDDPAKDILSVAQKRYQIEDCFRVMKTNFSARPVYHQNSERIKAHFLIYFTALLVYRLMEAKLDDNGRHHTVKEIQTTLKNMNIIDEFGAYYRALYTGSKTLDDLVFTFGLPLNHQYYQEKALRRMIKNMTK